MKFSKANKWCFCSETLHRVWGRTESANPLLRNQDFAFGALAPGQTREWTVPIEVPGAIEERWDTVSVILQAAGAEPVTIAGVILDDPFIDPSALATDGKDVQLVCNSRRALIRVVFARAGESAGMADDIAGAIAPAIERRLAALQAAGAMATDVHAGTAAQARAAALVRVAAWWTEDPARATRDEVAATLLRLDPGLLPPASTS